MRIAVLTSGGDAPGMNACIRGFVKVAIGLGHEPYGVRNGYEGLMNGKLSPLSLRDVDGITRFGGTMLGSARALEFHEPEGRQRAHDVIASLGIEGLVVVGGNGSLAGAHALAQEGSCRVIGIPASIDNDVGCTRTCIGVDTAINTIVDACDRISDTASAHHRAFIVEVMGRENGFLAMRAGLAVEADAILYAERKLTEDETVARLREMMKRSFTPERGKRRVLILKSEGFPVPTEILTRRLQEHLSEDAPGVTVRATILGHVVRGGSPSQADRVVAQRLSFNAAIGVQEGASDVMVGWDVPPDMGEGSADPRVRRIPLAEVLEETERVRNGSSRTTIGRIKLLERAEAVLAL